MKRCLWCKDDELYIKYHDEEWGMPVLDDRKHFEFLVLESAQAGLSWITILRKRESYREAYKNFEPSVVANFDDKRIEKIISESNIIRNKRKIKASINNAKRFLEIQSEFGSFNNYIWKFVDYKPITNLWKDESEVPSKTELSELISKDLKNRGFSFLGPTIVYSYMQAIGIVNDHVLDCFRHDEIKGKQNEHF